MQKILIIIDDITRSNGTERAVCNLANILSTSEKYQPTIISLNTANGNPYYPVNNNIKIIHCAVSVKNKLLRKIAEFKQLKNICDNEFFDIAIGVYPVISAQMLFIGSIKKKIAAEHNSYGAAPLWVKLVWRKTCYRFLDAVVLLTNADAVNYKFHKNAVVIPNSLSFIPNNLSSTENKVVLAIGRFTYQKGFERLIEAIAMIKENCLDWQVRIVGNGENKDKLQKQITDCGLEKTIKIISPTNKIEDEYCSAGFYVMSSRYEGLPMVLIEAKSCGLPIVSFDCPEGPADIIQNDTDGILIEKNNVKALSQAILKMIENPQLRKRYGQEAVKDIERFLPENIFNKWDNLFEKLKVQK